MPSRAAVSEGEVPSPELVMESKAPCPHMDSCPMYAIFKYAGTLAAWKLRYCTADYSACARYIAATKNQPVPPNLMPNGTLLKKGPPR